MKDADIEALVARLGYHSHHPVTGNLVLTNPDGPEAASALTSLKAERDRLSFKYGKALANWDRSLTRAETAERERDAEAAKALSNLEAMLAAENLAAEAILERDEARAEVERLRLRIRDAFNVGHAAGERWEQLKPLHPKGEEHGQS